MAPWRLKSPASRLFTQPFIQVQIKENIKAPLHWPLWGEFTGDRWIPRTKGQWRWKCFHLITSPWSQYKTEGIHIHFEPISITLFCYSWAINSDVHAITSPLPHIIVGQGFNTLRQRQIGRHFANIFKCIFLNEIVFQGPINTLRPRQNGCHFPDDIFKWIFLNENIWISLKIPLKFIPRGPINNIPALVQIMAWRRPGTKPLSEPMLVFVPTHICVTRPQWVNNKPALVQIMVWHQMGYKPFSESMMI